MTDIKVNTQDLFSLLSYAKIYTDEATLRIGNGKAEILEVDGTHTQMINGSIACDSDACEIPINLEKTIKAISAVGKDAILSIDEDALTVQGAHSKIKIPLMVREANFKWPPKFDGEAKAYCEIPPSLLAPMLSYGEYTSSGKAAFIIGDTKMRIEIGETPDISELESPNTAVGDCKVTIDLTYLNTLIKNIKGVPSVTVCGYADNNPLLFKWADGTGEFRVLIAPRIEDE